MHMNEYLRNFHFTTIYCCETISYNVLIESVVTTCRHINMYNTLVRHTYVVIIYIYIYITKENEKPSYRF